jgi:hypothetical protein
VTDEDRCGARKADGTICRNFAGAGTSHPKIGRCKYHGVPARTTPIAVERPMAEQRMRTYGSPIDVEPHVALLEEVRRTAGHVAWLSELVSDLLHEGDGYFESIDDDGKRTLRPKTGLKQIDMSGKFEKPSVWVELYQEERRMLARVCKMALDAGVAERQVALAEAQGEMLAGGDQDDPRRPGVIQRPAEACSSAGPPGAHAAVGVVSGDSPRKH